MLKSAPQCFGDDTALTIGFTRGVGSVFALQGGEHLPYAVELGTDSSYSVEPSDGVVLLPDHHEKAPTAVDERSHHHHSPPPPPPPPATAAAAAAMPSMAAATWTLVLKVVDASVLLHVLHVCLLC